MKIPNKNFSKGYNNIWDFETPKIGLPLTYLLRAANQNTFCFTQRQQRLYSMFINYNILYWTICTNTCMFIFEYAVIFCRFFFLTERFLNCFYSINRYFQIFYNFKSLFLQRKRNMLVIKLCVSDNVNSEREGNGASDNFVCRMCDAPVFFRPTHYRSLNRTSLECFAFIIRLLRLIN